MTSTMQLAKAARTAPLARAIARGEGVRLGPVQQRALDNVLAAGGAIAASMRTAYRTAGDDIDKSRERFAAAMQLVWPVSAASAQPAAALEPALVTVWAWSAPANGTPDHERTAAQRSHDATLARTRKALGRLGFSPLSPGRMGELARAAEQLGEQAAFDASSARVQHVWGPLEELAGLNPAAVRLERLARPVHDAEGLRAFAQTLPMGDDDLHRSAEMRTERLDEAAIALATSPKPDETLLPIWYGTNRSIGEHAFENRRDPRGDVHYGRAIVRFPAGYRFGGERPSWWRRLLAPWIASSSPQREARFDLPDRAAFIDSLRAAIDEAEPAALVVIHGYNTAFDGAIVRAAQLAYDIGFPGPVAAFSWPSTARVLGYLQDQQRADASVQQCADFLAAVSEAAGATRVHVVAHSMGNRVLHGAVLRMRERGVPLGAVVLAAPDIDRRVFLQDADRLAAVSRHRTLYVSDRDKALMISRWLQAEPRAGLTPPVTVAPGYDTIDVGGVDVSSFGHDYFTEAEPLLYDIRAVLRGEHDPLQRIRITARDDHFVIRP